MAGRSLPSPVSAGLAAFSSAIRCSGTLLGEVIVVAAPGTKLSPVITPPVLTVTSAVACCHHGFLTERTASLPPFGGYSPFRGVHYAPFLRLAVGCGLLVVAGPWFAAVTRPRRAGCSGAPAPAGHRGCRRSGKAARPAARSATECRPST